MQEECLVEYPVWEEGQGKEVWKDQGLGRKGKRIKRGRKRNDWISQTAEYSYQRLDGRTAYEWCRTFAVELSVI